MKKSALSRRKAFTLIELLIGIGIIGFLSGIVIIAINPKKQLEESLDATAAHHAKEIESAMYQHTIDKWILASADQIPEGKENAKTICSEGYSDPSCVTLSPPLPPDYVVRIPQDTRYTPPDSGFRIYKHAERPRVLAAGSPVGTEDVGDSCSSTTPTDYVACWSFDETAAPYLDSSDNGIAVTCIADECPTSVAGRIGKAVDFDGVNDYMHIDSSLASLLPQSYTFSAWFKTPGDGSLIGADDPIFSDGLQSLEIWVENGVLRISQPWTYGTTAVHDDAWHHVAFIFDDGNDRTRVFIDGTEEMELNVLYAQKVKSTDRYYLGAAVSTEEAKVESFLSGILDEVRVYNRVLSSTEIAELMNGG